jgi:hypothetical protein
VLFVFALLRFEAISLAYLEGAESEKVGEDFVVAAFVHVFVAAEEFELFHVSEFTGFGAEEYILKSQGAAAQPLVHDQAVNKVVFGGSDRFPFLAEIGQIVVVGVLVFAGEDFEVVSFGISGETVTGVITR